MTDEKKVPPYGEGLREHCLSKEALSLQKEALSLQIERHRADSRARKLNWKEECLLWAGRVLTGKYKHYCPEWDGLPIDETCPEFSGCVCFSDEEATEMRKKDAAYQPYFGCHNCIEDCSWPAADLKVDTNTGLLWCELCVDDLLHKEQEALKLVPFVPDHERQIRALQEEVENLRTIIQRIQKVETHRVEITFPANTQGTVVLPDRVVYADDLRSILGLPPTD